MFNFINIKEIIIIRNDYKLLITLPIALVLMIFVVLIKKIIIFRFGFVHSDRIGHFAANTELYLCDEINKKKKEYIPTGSCLILITPDSERTMCTFLGTAGKINQNDVNEDDIRNAEIIFLEGYLWDEGDPKKAFDKAIVNSRKVAMSLSDLFCVERHKNHFLELVKNKLDIIFANEQEIMSLINAKTFHEAISFSKEVKKNIIITRGEKGAVSIYEDEIEEINAQPNLKIKDLTGAGDLFAAGYLHGVINNFKTKQSLQKGTELSSKIIQKIGARL